jgi:hypothetical protein
MTHAEFAQVQCEQRLMPSLQTIHRFGNGPLQSLAFMHAFGFGVVCALSGVLFPRRTIATTETIERSRLADTLLMSTSIAGAVQT